MKREDWQREDGKEGLVKKGEKGGLVMEGWMG